MSNNKAKTQEDQLTEQVDGIDDQQEKKTVEENRYLLEMQEQNKILASQLEEIKAQREADQKTLEQMNASLTLLQGPPDPFKQSYDLDNLLEDGTGERLFKTIESGVDYKLQAVEQRLKQFEQSVSAGNQQLHNSITSQMEQRESINDFYRNNPELDFRKTSPETADLMGLLANRFQDQYPNATQKQILEMTADHARKVFKLNNPSNLSGPTAGQISNNTTRQPSIGDQLADKAKNMADDIAKMNQTLSRVQ